MSQLFVMAELLSHARFVPAMRDTVQQCLHNKLNSNFHNQLRVPAMWVKVMLLQLTLIEAKLLCLPIIRCITEQNKNYISLTMQLRDELCYIYYNK